MSLKVQPLADYVVAQAEEVPTKTAAGLYLPGGAAEKPKVAKVVAVGKNVSPSRDMPSTTIVPAAWEGSRQRTQYASPDLGRPVFRSGTARQTPEASRA